MDESDEVIPDEDQGGEEPLVEEGEEEVEDEGGPQPMDEDPPAKDKEEADGSQGTTSKVMAVIEFVEEACKEDVPYFSVYPQRAYFGASVSAGCANAVFIKMLKYFCSFGTTVDYDAIANVIRHLKVKGAHVVPTPPPLEDERKQRVEEIKAACQVLVTEHVADNFFIAIIDTEQRIHTFTGSHAAPYEPVFHLFHRLCAGIIPRPPFVEWATVKRFRLADNMKDTVIAWEEQGKESAPIIFEKAELAATK